MLLLMKLRQNRVRKVHGEFKVRLHVSHPHLPRNGKDHRIATHNEKGPAVTPGLVVAMVEDKNPVVEWYDVLGDTRGAHMAKGYFFAEIEITDPAEYETYRTQTMATLQK